MYRALRVSPSGFWRTSAARNPCSEHARGFRQTPPNVPARDMDVTWPSVAGRYNKRPGSDVLGSPSGQLPSAGEVVAAPSRARYAWSRTTTSAPRSSTKRTSCSHPRVAAVAFQEPDEDPLHRRGQRVRGTGLLTNHHTIDGDRGMSDESRSGHKASQAESQTGGALAPLTILAVRRRRLDARCRSADSPWSARQRRPH